MDNFSGTVQHGREIDRAFLLEQLQTANSVLLESARQDVHNTKNLLFSAPGALLIAYTLEEIPSIFEQIEKFLRQKKYLAGYFAYESGYHFENVVPHFENTSSDPLVWLGVYDQPIEIPADLLQSIHSEGHDGEIHDIEFKISLPAYRNKIEKIKQYLENGDTYQVNFTDRFEFTTTASASNLYFLLRAKQHVPYSAIIQTEHEAILSFSPELFFRRTGNSIITAPMKGTCRRGRTLDEDAELSRWLFHDEKNRSENLMIVDLLRNDIGRICETGSVKAVELFNIEKFETVLQMTSTISGTLQPGRRYYDIFSSLFPCGSVTGAPKIRTMQIISELEQHRRGVYCGAIGYFSPDDEAVFNVGIRTISLRSNKGILGVGGGVVADSVPEKEFDECMLKANFLTGARPDFSLLETILWNGTFVFLEAHLSRMQKSAEYFFIPFDPKNIIRILQREEEKFDQSNQYRVRLLVSQTGISSVESAEFVPAFPSPHIKIADKRSDSNDPFYFHKTTHRPLYNEYFQKLPVQNIADYIFMNEKGEITEGTYTNIFIKTNEILYTPPVSSGVLNGIYRSHLLSSGSFASEKSLFLDDLFAADEIFICNSLRGIQKVLLIT